MEKLTQEQVDAELETLPEWMRLGDTIQRTYVFGTFADAIAFVNDVALRAESVQHHPDILIRYNKVTLTLSTHDADGITRKDMSFASETDQRFGR